jgi:hypothetical protein
VELRAVQQGHYKWGERIEDYSPRVIGCVPVVSIHLGVDTDAPDFFFQMREDQIDDLISELLAARKELVAFREYISQDKTFRRQ